MAKTSVFLILLICYGFIQNIRGQTNERSKPNKTCETPLCSCCLENATCQSDGYCDGLCKVGFHGGKCLNNCPDHCVSCRDVNNPSNNISLWYTANCTQCESGYFSTTIYYQCQQTCPTQCEACNSATDCTSCLNGFYKYNTSCISCPTACASCTSASQCTQCNDGYYNSGISGIINCTACSKGCTDKCNNDTGICSCRKNYNGDKCDRCLDGKYGIENFCQYDCQSTCATCTSIDSCSSCVSEYILNGNTCQRCKAGCAQCSTVDDCDHCLVRYYMSADGKSCLPCSIGCSNDCNTESGECTCKPRFAGTKCSQCASNFQKYPQCDQCIAGYRDANCNRKCPANCKGNACDQYGDRCTNGCNGNFSGDNCSLCLNGWYGTACDLQCPSNCHDGSCNQSTGFCNSCKGNYNGNMCSTCAPGQYGNECSLNCSSNCENRTCIRTNGNCDNCIAGFSGDKCCMQGIGCQFCLSNYICSECVLGKYGEQCEYKCPTNCADTYCSKVNGTCITCVDGFHGDNCTLPLIQTSSGPDAPLAALAGGVTGGLVIIIAVVVLTFIFLKRRSINKNNRPKTMAYTDDLTTDRVYANDPAIIAASKETNKYDTYDTVTNTYDTVTNTEPPLLTASWKKGEAKPSTSERPDATNKLDESVKSAKVVKLDKSVKPDKPVKPEMAAKRTKLVKAAKQLKMPLSPDARMDNNLGNESFEEEDDKDYYNSDASPDKGIPVSELASYVAKKDFSFFNNEYAKLPKGLVKSTDAALLDQNLSKNRYNAIYPYDETRVVLAGPGSDFINACYIDGYRKKRRYIASLGPISKATEGFKTFWRMVWQEKTEKIVMVTNLMESGGMKCEQYWPDKNVTLAYGDAKVTCHSEDVYAEYTVRSFTVRKKNEQRSLHHIHYTAWPDKGVPDDVTSLVEFRNKVNSTKTTLRGPIIVHCSAGVGRTGTYIALDILTLKGERTGFVDIFECVSKLRQQRTCMVQTAEQYEYLHRALVHTLTLESEAIPADHFMAYTASLRDDIFDRLSHCTEKISTEEMEAIDRNKAYSGYNRPGADIPGDNNRPRLYYGRTTEDNDYINALFVNSFKRKNQFILTQTPLPNTVDDFLSLVVQENCCCIVSMDAADLLDKTIGTYLPPDNQTLTTDTYEVRIKKLDSNHIYSQRTLTITSKNKSSTLTVQHFRCTNWSDNDKTPKSPSEFLTFVKHIQKVADETTQFSPIIIHCRTGSERSVLPCVVLSLLQKIEIEHEVSVINTVRQVKVRRSKSIPNKEQFKFCHQCVSAYLQTFDIYSNFS